jgi:hypothetical protein
MTSVTKVELIQWFMERGVCEEALAWARAQATARDIVERCPHAAWRVWLLQQIGGEAWAEYDRVTTQPMAEYERATSRAVIEYERVMNQVRTEYRSVTDQASAERRRRATGLAMAEYRRAMRQAIVEYERILCEAARAGCTWERVADAVRRADR